jgi:hypothetical protein
MSRDFRIDQNPDEILRLMEANLSGNNNYETIGAGWLAYKAGEMNAKATRRLTFATWVLAVIAFIQLCAFGLNVALFLLLR